VALGWVHRPVGEEADGDPLAIAVLGTGWRSLTGGCGSGQMPG